MHPPTPHPPSSACDVAPHPPPSSLLQDPKQQQQQGARSGYISRVQDIDSLLKEERHRPRSHNHIMDAPVPPTSHYPLKPSPVQSPPPTRPNSYAFESSAQGNSPRSGNSMRPSKSLGDKLIDVEDEKVQRQRAAPPLNAPPAPSSSTSGGKRNKVKETLCVVPCFSEVLWLVCRQLESSQTNVLDPKPYPLNSLLVITTHPPPVFLYP